MGQDVHIGSLELVFGAEVGSEGAGVDVGLSGTDTSNGDT